MKQVPKKLSKLFKYPKFHFRVHRSAWPWI